MTTTEDCIKHFRTKIRSTSGHVESYCSATAASVRRSRFSIKQTIESIKETGVTDARNLAIASVNGYIAGAFAGCSILLFAPIKSRINQPLAKKVGDVSSTLVSTANVTGKGFAKSAFVNTGVATVVRHLLPGQDGEIVPMTITGFCTGYTLTWGYPLLHRRRLRGGMSFAAMTIALKALQDRITEQGAK